MKLERFLSFNESLNQDVYKLDRNSAENLITDDPVGFCFIGSRVYTLYVNGEKQAFELIPADAESIKMTFGEFSNRKEDIVSFEPTEEEGETLYKWIARILSVVEWSNTSNVSKWHTFESESGEHQPLGSTDTADSSSQFYTLNTPTGIYELIIFRDLSTFKLTDPYEGTIVGTLDDLMQNSEYYKNFEPGEALYNWIQFSFGRALMKGRNEDKDKPTKTRFEKLAVNHNIYAVEYDPETNQGTLYLPARSIDFTLEDIYERLPELPALESGEVDRKIRKRLEYYNIQMPPAPYEIGFVLKNKRT